MNFLSELKQGQLIKRYKRFFADIEHEGETLTAHVPNTGSLTTVLEPGWSCYFSTSNDPKRKLKYTLELSETPTGLAGVNTRTPNTVTQEALLEGLKGNYQNVQPEFKISDKSRIDFALWNWKGASSNQPKKLKFPDHLKHPKIDFHFIEVKNVTLAEDTTAMFPDAVTTRGTKHLNELIELKKQGHSTEILFFVQRENMSKFKPAAHIDPVYAETLKKAYQAGVKVSAYPTHIDKKKVILKWNHPLPIQL